jgi:hypothetical protein
MQLKQNFSPDQYRRSAPAPRREAVHAWGLAAAGRSAFPGRSRVGAGDPRRSAIIESQLKEKVFPKTIAASEVRDEGARVRAAPGKAGGTARTPFGIGQSRVAGPGVALQDGMRLLRSRAMPEACLPDRKSVRKIVTKICAAVKDFGGEFPKK